MGISSLGVGSGILTQDVLDQLRAADESQRIRPIDLNLAFENDKIDAFKIVQATMKNYVDSTNAIRTASLWDGRSTEVTSGKSVSLSAISKTDIQDFTINVTALATKQVEQSGSFAAQTDTIASGAGTMNLNVDGKDFTIDYDATTTLKDLKDTINKIAGEKINATIVQVSSGDFRLFTSSVDTGTTQDITMSDSSGNLNDARLTTGGSVIQSGSDSAFTFNGQAITRTDNKISDLITGLTLTLEETGISEVSIKQDRTGILEKFDSFVEKYNSNIIELGKQTKASNDSETRGIFSSDSTMKSMKRALEDVIGTVGGGVGTMIDYGFNVDKDGKMTLDKTVLEKAMDTNQRNVQAFFSGGTFVKENGSEVTLTGAFTDIAEKIEIYTKRNKILDQLKEEMDGTVTSLETRKTSATERLDAKYAILKKQYAAYDAVINRINSASSVFTQIANAQTAAQNG